MRKFFGHLKTVTKHRYLVFKHCVKAGIFWRGLLHDLSKFSPVEFINGVKNYTDGTRSPNDKERIKRGYSMAWLHHKGKNKHHFEYWTEINLKGVPFTAFKMPLVYVKEMICDRISACKTYQKENYTDESALTYFINRGDARYMHEDTKDLVLDILTQFAMKGEKEGFSYLRKLKEY